MTPGPHATQSDRRAHGGTHFELDSGTGQRDVDNLAIVAAAIVENDGGMANVGNDALMAAVFRQIEQVFIGQPGELRCHLVALARGGGDVHHETTIDLMDDCTFNASDMVEIGNDALAHYARDWRNDHGIAGGHGQDLAWKFAAVCKHVTAQY